MPEPLVPADPGLLASLLDTATLGGSAVRNLLKGNIEGAGRNLIDVQGRAFDAFLPGDLVPDLSRAEDRPEFRDVVDLGGDNIATDLLNFAGDVATDPLTYVPGAAFAKAGTLAKQGIKKGVGLLPKAVREPLTQGAEKVGQKVRATFGAQRVSEATANALRAKLAASDLVGRAGSEGAVGALSGLSERELTALGEAGHNLRLDPVTGRPATLIDPTETLSFDQRLAKLMADDPSINPERLLAAAPKFRETLKSQWESGLAPASEPGGGVFFSRPMESVPDVVMGGYKEIPSQGVSEYFPRQFSGLKEDEIDLVTGLPKELPGFQQAVGGVPSPLKQRAEWGPQDILKYLTENPQVNLEFNAAKALAKRAGAQGEAAGRAQIGQSLFNRAASGEIPLTDDLVQALLPKATATESRAVVGPSGTAMSSEVADMLSGGARQGPLGAAPDIVSPYKTEGGILGNLADKENSWAKWEAEQNAKEVGMGLGEQSGKSVVGASTAPTMRGVTEADHIKAREWLKSNDFKLADPEMKAAATAIAKQFPAEEATVLLGALNGLAPRGAFTSALAKLNTHFKGPVVFGAVVPKLGAITRNLTGGLFMQMANAEARGDTLRAAAQLVPNWLKSIDDGIEKLFGARIGKNEFAEVEAAYKASGGDPRKVLPMIKDKDMREAVKNGILGNNFVNSEEIINSAAKGGWRSFGKNLLSYPASMFLGAEQRMRFGLWKSLRKQGKSEADAQRIVSDTFFDYGINSPENRAIRSYLPFAQFAMKAIPSQGNAMLRHPWTISALANASGGASGPVYPGMSGKTNIPIGRDEEGNRQFITSLGLPVESLNMIPNPSANLLDFGRQFEQNIVGASQPLLKTAYSATSGRDPYFGSQFGSYDKLPVIGSAGGVGRAINQLTSTGLPGAAQTSGLLQLLGKTTDERTTLPEKLLSVLTGAKIQSVDESRALQQQLEELLKRNPSIAQYTTLYNRDGDEETQALLEQLKQAKADIKAKQKAMANVQ